LTAGLVDRLPVTGDILRGSLLRRTIRNHAKSCARCASGEGHNLAVLTVSYAGGRTWQILLQKNNNRIFFLSSAKFESAAIDTDAESD
jgi:hypothetical protein